MGGRGGHTTGRASYNDDWPRSALYCKMYDTKLSNIPDANPSEEGLNGPFTEFYNWLKELPDIFKDSKCKYDQRLPATYFHGQGSLGECEFNPDSPAKWREDFPKYVGEAVSFCESAGGQASINELSYRCSMPRQGTSNIRIHNLALKMKFDKSEFDRVALSEQNKDGKYDLLVSQCKKMAEGQSVIGFIDSVVGMSGNSCADINKKFQQIIKGLHSDKVSKSNYDDALFQCVREIKERFSCYTWSTPSNYPSYIPLDSLPKPSEGFMKSGFQNLYHFLGQAQDELRSGLDGFINIARNPLVNFEASAGSLYSYTTFGMDKQKTASDVAGKLLQIGSGL